MCVIEIEREREREKRLLSFLRSEFLEHRTMELQQERRIGSSAWKGEREGERERESWKNMCGMCFASESLGAMEIEAKPSLRRRS